ncbi:MAG: bifunctional shikimate kinase/3-dehydroquinate synthase [Gaiellales bacterium]
MSRPDVLVGFMGAGKSTVGTLLAELRGTAFVDVDREIERRSGRSIPDLFADGEDAFRELEEQTIAELVEAGEAGVLALGGGALGRHGTRRLRAARARVRFLDAPLDVLWARVEADGGAGTRPLAVSRHRFEDLYLQRRMLYLTAADAIVDAAAPPEVAAIACRDAGTVRLGALERLADLAADRRCLLIVDEPGADRGPALGPRVVLPGGEQVKTPATLEALWRAMAEHELERRDLVCGVGGGAVTDVAGFAAATFRRGLDWVSCPTTLVGQVDAGIGGKTGIDVAAKNDVGAFHPPVSVLSDPALLATLPDREWAAGFAEVLKTALVAGEPLWPLVRDWPNGRGPDEAHPELVRRSAALKERVVAADPREAGERAVLNLGHTIGHGVEHAAGGRYLHGEAIAIGLAAALELSIDHAGLDPAVREEALRVLARQGLPIRAEGLEPEAVIAAMRADKKRVQGAHRFVLLEAPGRPRWGVQLDEAVVAAAVAGALA